MAVLLEEALELLEARLPLRLQNIPHEAHSVELLDVRRGQRSLPTQRTLPSAPAPEGGVMMISRHEGRAPVTHERSKLREPIFEPTTSRPRCGQRTVGRDGEDAGVPVGTRRGQRNGCAHDGAMRMQGQRAPRDG